MPEMFAQHQKDFPDESLPKYFRVSLSGFGSTGDECSDSNPSVEYNATNSECSYVVLRVDDGEDVMLYSVKKPNGKVVESGKLHKNTQEPEKCVESAICGQGVLNDASLKKEGERLRRLLWDSEDFWLDVKDTQQILNPLSSAIVAIEGNELNSRRIFQNMEKVDDIHLADQDLDKHDVIQDAVCLQVHTGPLALTPGKEGTYIEHLLYKGRAMAVFTSGVTLQV
uniref:Uncharacterized protein n=1 Tax=Ditylenchus dipsaci TaxID=166011 RepID=A0A915EQ10_9BILA